MQYKTAGNRGLFDEQNAMNLMSYMGNSLERPNEVIDFELFRP